MLLVDNEIAWIGSDSDAHSLLDSTDVVVDVGGALVTPGFVDAHVHMTSTGLVLDGLDLSQVRSRRELLDAVAHHAAAQPGGVLLGHGWDETTWRGEDGDRTPPTRTEIDAACGNRPAYLTRIDVHSALVSTALIRDVPGVEEAEGFDPTGALSREAHHQVRAFALASVDGQQRRRAHLRVLEHAARRGIVCLQENAGPAISSETDLIELLKTSTDFNGPRVSAYWAELAQTGGIERARELGAIGVAGDLFVDGAIGSRTACLCGPYADSPDKTGAAYLDSDDVAEHVASASRAGVQAGFHVIGDQACHTVVAGILRAAETVGEECIRASVHRLEHAEMLSDADIAVMARLGIVASMQPMFDALWGDPGGMYEQRLGMARSSRMNRIKELHSRQVPVAFSSDSPVTEMDPWLGIRAAVLHHTHAERVDVETAIDLHSRGGWHAMRVDAAGTLAAGAPAHVSIWKTESAAVPDFTFDEALPQCLATIVDGRVIYSSGELELSQAP